MYMQMLKMHVDGQITVEACIKNLMPLWIILDHFSDDEL